MKLNILVIEDNQPGRELLSDWLEVEGFGVVAVENLEQAFAAFREQPPHAVLLDVQVGLEDGLSLVKWIRDAPQFRNTPVIAVTAHAMVADRERVMQAGCNAVVSKPIDFKLLKKHLAACLPEMRFEESREQNDGTWTVDDLLTRHELSNTIAIATGRMITEGERESVASGKTKTSLTPPPRAEALRLGQLILVAEDNDTNRKVMSSQLTLLGFAADFTAEGGEALHLWRSGDYALLVTDLHMPAMDGYELVKAIRAEEKEKAALHIPAIALTANALKSEELRCLEAGMNAYLSKPIQLAELKAALDRWMPKPVLNLPPVDTKMLVSLIGNDPRAIREILINFRETLKLAAPDIAIACTSGLLPEISRLAHNLKSAALSVGASTLAKLCGQMEGASKIASTDDLNSLCERFVAEVARVDSTLTALTADGVEYQCGHDR